MEGSGWRRPPEVHGPYHAHGLYGETWVIADSLLTKPIFHQVTLLAVMRFCDFIWTSVLFEYVGVDFFGACLLYFAYFCKLTWHKLQVMSRCRFLQIKRYLHFNNNEDLPANMSPSIKVWWSGEVGRLSGCTTRTNTSSMESRPASWPIPNRGTAGTSTCTTACRRVSKRR